MTVSRSKGATKVRPRTAANVPGNLAPMASPASVDVVVVAGHVRRVKASRGNSAPPLPGRRRLYRTVNYKVRWRLVIQAPVSAWGPMAVRS